ncbi:MAG: hypothetical protein OEN50_11135 [Deltaproteobacteria bacterium]|nr:hypothetical protein [Deltaproteobacteria bacterium]
MSDTEKNDPPAQTDLFHRGVITKLFPSNNTGFVRIESAREIPFSYEFVILCGEAKTVHDLREGDPVGYDLGWTPSGLRVTKIKTYANSARSVEASNSERQRTQRENLPS